MSTPTDFAGFFEHLTTGKVGGIQKPYDWQVQIASNDRCSNRLIRIPTGFGKTLGILSAWLWHAWHRRDAGWPRRLLICLPMRVLVEQTEQEVRSALAALNVLWDDVSDHEGKIGAHVLMGGVESSEWYLYPEHFAVLICTQDMALSRGMNRGYTVPRARWPTEFGLLNQDTLWVMDEVQLMDVGLATSAQLQAFRDDDRAAGRGFRPCYTWWMSATLQPNWLGKSPDTLALTSNLPSTRIAAEQRNGHLWDDVTKPCRVERVKDAKALSALVAEQHIERGKGRDGPTLVVVNTVERATTMFETLREKSAKELQGTEILLVHSRFRPQERQGWRDEFLNRAACTPGTDRIIVATQVVEAGVDISASLLVTELAPWASLVQRFGRSARWGGHAQVIVGDLEHADDKSAAPYNVEELDAARHALALLDDVAPMHLERFEEEHPELLTSLYPYEPTHLLLRHELDELFDTTPDLSGADIDISRFIRSGDERDVRVFWVNIPGDVRPSPIIEPTRDALCAVPFLKARDWLFGGASDTRQAPGKHAWVWNWLDGRWVMAQRSDLYPGQTVLVSADSGGYDVATGWTGKGSEPVPAASSIAPANSVRANEEGDRREDTEALSAYDWQTIAVHNREVGLLARSIATALTADKSSLLALAGRWHDGGKAHVAFQNCIVRSAEEPFATCRELAKAPESAWLPLKKLYPINGDDGKPIEHRQGFRHELASVLMLFAVLQRHAPDHPALLGPWRELLQQAGMNATPTLRSDTLPCALEREIIALDADDFNLLAYLVCTHHGKVRVTWHASPADQAAKTDAVRIRGIVSGDVVPSVRMVTADGQVDVLPECRLDLAPASAGINSITGMAWTERVLGLLEQFGPFALAWLESLLIAADRRASRRRDIRDELLYLGCDRVDGAS